MSHREILFKARRTDNGEWVEGYLCKHPSAVQVGEYSPWYIHVPAVDPDDSGGVYNVYSGTVCQYTGLTDKNGKKIFEWDKLVVCLDSETKDGIVKYNTDSASFWMDFSDCFSTFLDFEIAKRKVGEKVWIQVKGNIHDN